MRGKLAAIAAAGALLVLAAVAPAMAGHGKVKHIETDVTIKTDQAAGTISGKVKSDNDKCVTKRKVVLNVDGTDVFHEKADENGRYGIETSDGSSLDPGDYEVHAPKLQISSHKVCDPGNSKVVTVN